MNEKTIRQLQTLPRVSIENGITYYIIPQEEYEKLKDKEQECEELKKNLNEGCLQHLTLMTEQQVLLKTQMKIG